ncbi:oxidation resistance protein 1 [Mucor velutinosus]|uniref:Oxidation resistance protein 1 n=1 Tax=Mucor velutinosus TaxID=708070 RepID=A0AAN7DHX7_9FUNG|nr:oxidation resistance protein 1 [Mucor velutinosus]
MIRKDIITLTYEFLETWLHQLLYKCELYPKAVFKQQKKFQVPVYIALHPQVHAYIADFVQACQPLLETGNVRFIALTVMEDADRPLEKFVLEIRSLLHNTNIPADTVLQSESSFTLADLEQYLRACLIKLNTYQFPNKQTTSDTRTFILSIEKIQGGYPHQQLKSNDGSMDWVPAETSYRWKNIKPLKSVELDLIRFNTFVMEASRKGKERCP